MPKSRWSTNRQQVTVSDDPDLVVSVPLLLDGVKVATVKLTATDSLAFRVDFTAESGFVGLAGFEAWSNV